MSSLSTSLRGSLTAQVAVVTGAADGIGRAIATRLAAEGAIVAAVDRSPAVEATVMAIRAADGRATPHVADLADRAARAGLIPAVRDTHGRVDILVNNAAFHGARISILDLTEEDWDQVIETNLTAVAQLAQAVARDVVSRGAAGSIVNIGAIQQILPLPTYAAYGASKGGLAALTRCLAAELSPHGIRVNTVAPGSIATNNERTDTAAGPPATLLGRHGTAEELAAAVAFLVSDEASFITGTELRVDGGRSISRRTDPFVAES